MTQPLQKGDVVSLKVQRLGNQPGAVGTVRCRWPNGGVMVQFDERVVNGCRFTPVTHCYEREVQICQEAMTI